MFLEEGGLLRITEAELLHFGLYVGLDIDTETVIKLKKYGVRSETRMRAAALAARRPLSQKELKCRLMQKGAEEEDAVAAVEYLQELGALDDASYAAMLVRYYSQRGYGKNRICDELCRRGVERSMWAQALEEMPDAEDTIEAFLQKKLKGRSVDEKEIKRLSNALLRRGFSWGEIAPVIRRFGIKTENEEE